MARRAPESWTRALDVASQEANIRYRRWAAFGAVMTFAAFVGLIAHGNAPHPFALAFTILVAACVVSFARPVTGVYVIVFFSLVGDYVTTPWWPFNKNLSSRESILFVHDSISFNPMEILLGVTFLSFVLRKLDDPTWTFRRGRLFWPLLVFTFFVLVGVVYGVISGGDRRVIVYEARELFYLPLVYILVTNLILTKRAYQALLVVAMVAVSIQSLFALSYYRGLSPIEQDALEALGEHSATIHMNALFLFLLALALLRCQGALRWGMIALTPPVMYAYLLSQRRAAMISFFVGVILLTILLYHLRRRAFWWFTPTVLIVGTGLVMATWSAEGALGLPAKAVKTVVAPDQLSGAEQASNAYRQIEGFNLWFTIRQNPPMGVGFGKPYLMPWPQPNISFVEFWQFIPHNSVLWIWLKMGFLGFVAMLFLFARAVQHGTRSALSVPTRKQAAFVIAGLGYTVMYLVFAYVDIAWDIRSMAFLAVAFALCADYCEAADEQPSRARRAHDAADAVLVPVAQGQALRTIR